MRRALAGEEQVFERVIHGPDGVDRHSLARYTPEFSNGGVVGFFVEVSDVSHLKAIENSLRQGLAALKQKRPRRIAARRIAANARRAEVFQDAQREIAARLEAEKVRRSEFLVQLAHELRNSLAPIDSGARLLVDPHTAPQVAQRVRAAVSRQVGHMSQLVDDLLDMSGLDAGVLSISLRSIDLKGAIEQAVEMSLPLLQRAGHQLVLDVAPYPIPIDGDRKRLIQVVSNLLNNAAKYTPAGGRISLTARSEGGHARLSVQDNGIGFPPEAANLIFDMFTQRNDSSRESEGGLGVGLALVRQIVRAHGGTVTAASDGAGQGSRFLVSLPLAGAR